MSSRLFAGLFFVSPLVIALLAPACAAQPAEGERFPELEKHPLAGQAIHQPAEIEPGQVDLPRYPSISPDGKTLAFSWRGDVWRVDAAGGQASRLTAHPGDDLASVWSPDGKRIAFNSNRTGWLNLFVMNADGTAVEQISAEDRYLFLHDWVDGGEKGEDYLTLASYYEPDVYREPRPYRVNVTGGSIDRLHDAFGRQPAVSPDGRHVAFVRGGSSWDRPFIVNSNNRDIWLYDRQEQTFRRLTHNRGNDGKPRWLDNDTIVYQSARPPERINLYRLDLSDESDEDAVALTGFAEDVRHFDIAREAQIAVMQVWDRLYTLDLKAEGAEPRAVAITAAADVDGRVLVKSLPGEVDEVAVSPDGKVMAMSVHGDLFVRTVDSQNPPQRITRGAARDYQLAWSPDGVKLYFVSDQDGTKSIYTATVSLTRAEIEAAVLPQDSGPNELTNHAGEHEAGGDKPEEAAEDVPDPSRWHDAMRFEIDALIQTAEHDSGPSPSPDGKTLAFRRGNGNVMLMDLQSGATRAFFETWDARTHWVWSYDSQYLALSTQDQDHNADIWLGPVDGSEPLVNLSKHPAYDGSPSFSADGRILSFVSTRNNRSEVFSLFLDESLESYTPQQLEDYFKAAAEAAKKRKPLAIEGGADTEKPKAGKDGKDEQADKAGDTAAADEEENAEADDAEPDAADQDKQKKKEAAARPEPIVYENLDRAYLRIRRLTHGGYYAQLLPGGDRVLFTRGNDLYSVNWKGQGEKKLADRINPSNLTPNGSQLAGVRSGNAHLAATDSGKLTQVELPGTIRVDREAANAQRFAEAARTLSSTFYDPTYKGIDWPAVTEKYALLAERAWTTDEFNDIANRYLGLLDASHMGIRAPAPPMKNTQANGYLGARYQRVEAGFEVVAIYDDTPAATGPMRLQVGDIITHIDFQPIAVGDTVPARLVGRIGHETPITVLRNPDAQQEDANKLVLLLTPIGYAELDKIAYNNWQLAKTRRVGELSDGKLGYIHIQSMNASSLAEFERDLYAACAGKKGMIIDVRDNGGGWTTDRLLASIMTRRHAYTVPRGADPERTNSYPVDRLFITRYNLPMNALCNENSFSNAEIFSHAFKTLDRGTLVGEVTGGGVISTGSHRLLDGTSIRIPFRGWYLPDGTGMENNGAIPDLIVEQFPEDEVKNNDPQLEAAVQDLLNRVDGD